MRLNVLALTVLALMASALPVSAQIHTDKLIPVSLLSAESVAKMAAESTEATLPQMVAPAKADNGGKTLVLLQAGMVALQAMDIVSTRQALSRPGAYEANAAFGSANPSMGATIALKAGATASIILLTNRIAKTNRVAAIVTMVALNSAYATISAHNFAIAHGR